MSSEQDDYIPDLSEDPSSPIRAKRKPSSFPKPDPRDTTSPAPNGESGRSAPSGKILSFDDIRAGLSEMAENGAGAQRAAAYRMLMSLSQGDAILPEPMSTSELIYRGTRILRGLGQKYARLCYIRAFPNRLSAKRINREPLNAEENGIDINRMPRSLKQLYKRYPEIKQPGFPKGYPVKHGKAEIQDWCQREGVKIELDRIAAKKADAEIDLRGTDAETDKTATGLPAPVVQPHHPAPNPEQEG